MSRPIPALDGRERPARERHRSPAAGGNAGTGLSPIALADADVVADGIVTSPPPLARNTETPRRSPRRSPRRRSASGGGARAIAVIAAGLAVLAVVVGRWGDGSQSPPEPQVAESPAVASSAPRASAPSPETPAPTPRDEAVRDMVVPRRASGTMRALPVPGQDSTGAGKPVRYSVEIEDGLRVDEAEYTRTVRAVLTDRRGWETQDGMRFVHVDPAQASDGAAVDVHITLASPDTVDRLCAPLDTAGEVSCQNGDRVVLNAVRWMQGVSDYAGQLPQYREYLVNHEVGHALGHGHAACPGPGRPAPVMLQQTLGLDGCTRYPWPVPDQVF